MCAEQMHNLCVQYNKHKGGAVYAEKAIDGAYEKMPLQQKKIQVLYCIFYILCHNAMPGYKADMVADIGRGIYLPVQIICDRKVYIGTEIVL